MRIAGVWGWGLCLLVVASGCWTQGEAMSPAERQRQEMDPRARQLMLQAEQAYRQGNYAVALALSDSIETLAPNLADLHFFRGRIYTDLNQLDVANAAYEAALSVDPGYHGANMNIGINHFRRGEMRDAINHFRREEAHNANSNLYLELGRAYARLSEADSARVAYEQAIAMDSTNATAYMWLGQLFEEMGDFDKALTYSRRGADLKPDNLDYRYIIGSQLFRMGQVEEAVAYLEPVAEQRRWHHGAQYNLGQALLRLGREADAQRYLQQADTAQQLQQEINEAQDAINRDPYALDQWLRLGEAHRKAGMYDRAIDALRRAITLQPWNLSLQINLATLMLEGGDADGAIGHYQRVLRTDSMMTDAWLNLGVAYGNSGRYDEARAAWQKVLQQDPHNRTARQFLARLDQMERKP